MESNGDGKPVLDEHLCVRCWLEPTDTASHWCERCFLKILEPWVPEPLRQQVSGSGGGAAGARAASRKATEKEEVDCAETSRQLESGNGGEARATSCKATEEDDDECRIVGESFDDESFDDESSRQRRRQERREREAASRPKEGEVIDCESLDLAVPSGGRANEAQSTVLRLCALGEQAVSPSARSGNGKELAGEEGAPVSSAPAISAPAAGGVQVGFPGARELAGEEDARNGRNVQAQSRKRRYFEQPVRRSTRLNLPPVDRLDEDLRKQREGALRKRREGAANKYRVRPRSEQELRAIVGPDLPHDPYPEGQCAADVRPVHIAKEVRTSGTQEECLRAAKLEHWQSIASCAKRKVTCNEDGCVVRFGLEVDGSRWGRRCPPEANLLHEGPHSGQGPPPLE
jgi:hypothetical protein